jgi:hypothetical protein
VTSEVKDDIGPGLLQHPPRSRRLRQVVSDPGHDLLDIANRSGLPFSRIHEAAATLHTAGLLSIAQDSP